MDYQPIENYGIIGDLHTVALVGLNGSIDFMCYPEFDSPTIFAALLDKEKGGTFQICSTQAEVRNKQLYLPDTNVLITRFLSKDGVGEVIDFMPIAEGCPKNVLVRRVKSVRGTNAFMMRCQPRFNYARTPHKTISQKHALIFLPQEEEGLGLKLQSSLPLQIQGNDAAMQFTLHENESADFILSRIGDTFSSDSMDKTISTLQFETINYWRNWLSGTQYRGRWQEIVNRSALLLKLMTAKQYGSIVASPTFGRRSGVVKIGTIVTPGFVMRHLRFTL